jgi:hypothetical protein
VSEPTIDPERLAALLDGRLTEAQRAELLAQLAGSEPDLEILATAIAAARDAEAHDAATSSSGAPAANAPVAGAAHREASIAPRRTGSWREPAVRWAALAAGIAIIVLIPFVRSRLARPATGDSARYVALLGAGATLPTGWDGHPWSTTRGATDALTADSRDARIGARLVDLGLAVQSRDTTAASIASDIATLLEPLPASGPLTSLYHQLASRIRDSTADWAPLALQARSATQPLIASAAGDAGAWLEAARIAAARHDASFFTASESRAALVRLAELPTLTDSDREAMVSLRSKVTSATQPDWAGVGGQISQLLDLFAR